MFGLQAKDLATDSCFSVVMTKPYMDLHDIKEEFDEITEKPGWLQW